MAPHALVGSDFKNFKKVNMDYFYIDSCLNPAFCLNGEVTMTGARCRCNDRYQGDRCYRCSERFQGDGCGNCSVRFKGAECDTCAGGYYGDSCGKYPKLKLKRDV